jgi:putative oxidoreductase
MKQHLSGASLLLRLSIGGMMITHGYPKVIRLISGEMKFPDPLGFGELPSFILTVFAEFVCSILIIIGWKTKLATVPPAIVMLVAATIIHWDDPWKQKEFALLYLIGYITIFLIGSGKYSLDWKLKKP